MRIIGFILALVILSSCTNVVPEMAILSSKASVLTTYQGQMIVNNKKIMTNYPGTVIIAVPSSISEVAVGEGESCDALPWQARTDFYNLNFISSSDGDKFVSFRYRGPNATSECYTEKIILDTAAPDIAGVATSIAATLTSLRSKIPMVSWGPATDLGVGVKHYELSIGTTLGASNISNWKSVGSGLSGDLSGLALSVGTYYVNWRAVDYVGHASSSVSHVITTELAPPIVTLVSPQTSPNVKAFVTVEISAVAIGDVVKLYSDSSCISELASMNALADAVSITLPLLSGDGEYSFYSTTSANGSTSNCAGGVSYVLDTVGPVISIGSASTSAGNAISIFDWQISFDGADVVSLVGSDIVLTGNGTAGCVASVLGSGAVSRTVRVTGCSGSGVVGFKVKDRVAKDFAGNFSVETVSSSEISIGNSAPVVGISAPSPLVGKSTSDFIWVVTYAGASAVSLSISDITLIGDGSVGCQVLVGGMGSASRNVIVSDCSGSGEVGISIAANTAIDTFGNQASAAASAKAKVDQTTYTVQFEKTNFEINEGNAVTPQSFKVLISPTPTQAVKVNYRVNPNYTTAVYPTNFSLRSGSVTIPAGSSSATIPYNYYGNSILDNSKKILVNLGDLEGPFNFALGDNQSAELFAKDDDGGGVQFLKVSVGLDHTCAITTTGQLKCWGRNFSGKLGTGDMQGVVKPTTIDSGVLYKEVAAGWEHTCGITTAGVLKCWGLNNGGAIGDGTQVDKLLPTVIDAGETYVSVSTASGNTCAITASGMLKCWGTNSGGQLGVGDLVDRILPVTVDPGVAYVQISNSFKGACGITTANILKCWGQNETGRLGDGTVVDSLLPKVIDSGVSYGYVSVDGSGTCAITIAKILKCWGRDPYGGDSWIGNGTKTGTLSPEIIESVTKYESVSKGSSNTCGITDSGVMKCWGSNQVNALGDNTGLDRLSPQVANSGFVYNSVAVGVRNSCGIATNGILKCWGSSSWAGGSGLWGYEVLSAVNLPFSFSKLETDFQTACGLAATGSLYCWGQNWLFDPDQKKDRTAIAQIDSGTLYSSFGAGSNTSCGLTVSGVVKCWGYYGNSPKFFPQVVDGTNRYQKLSFSNSRWCGIQENGNLRCGEVNPGTVSDLDVGVDYALIFASFGHYTYCGITTLGVLKCNASVVDAGVNYKTISTKNHTCGITASDDLKCWGDNMYGQIGDGTTVAKSLPVTIDPGVKYKSVDVGYYHTCGVTIGGVLKCWGALEQISSNYSSQFTPLSLDPGTAYAFVSKSCAQTTTGQYKCWGLSRNGIFGDEAQVGFSVIDVP